MKKIIYLAVLLLWCGWLTAQKKYSPWEFGIMFGRNLLTNSIPYLDNAFSPGVSAYFHRNIFLKDRLLLSTGIGYNAHSFIVDGYFTQANGDYDFSHTPDNYKQNIIRTGNIQLPLFIKYIVFTNGAKGVAVGVGPSLDYLVYHQNKYKIGDNQYVVTAPIENKWLWSLHFDVSTIDKRSSFGPVWGFGVQYQAGNFLRDKKSFNPVFLYFKAGISF